MPTNNQTCLSSDQEQNNYNWRDDAKKCYELWIKLKREEFMSKAYTPADELNYSGDMEKIQSDERIVERQVTSNESIAVMKARSEENKQREMVKANLNKVPSK